MSASKCVLSCRLSGSPAAQWLKAAALIAAVARDLAKRKQGQDKDEDKGEDPPRPRRISLTIDGEVPLAEAASGRTPQPGPTRPDGSFDPHRGREFPGAAHGKTLLHRARRRAHCRLSGRHWDFHRTVKVEAALNEIPHCLCHILLTTDGEAPPGQATLGPTPHPRA